jgi:general secretion pathway protein G
MTPRSYNSRPSPHAFFGAASRDGTPVLSGRAADSEPSHAASRRPMRLAMTLVEVLAVVVILGLLAGTLAISLSGAVGKGKREIARTGIGLIQQKVETYRIEHGSWPPDSLGLAALGDGHADPASPYFLSHDQLLDPWNTPFYLIVPGPDRHPYEIVSYGADGQPGGVGENEDLSSVRLRETP